MATSSTSNGLSILGNMPWSTHFCFFYKRKEDFLDTVITFFRMGLTQNEFCLWVLSDPRVAAEEGWRLLHRAIPGAEEHALAERLEIISQDEWFLQGGNFEIPKVMKLMRAKYDKALSRGLSGMRLCASTAWLQTRRGNDFQALEQTLSDSIADRHIVVLCSFPLDRSQAGEMLTAVHTHHLTLAIRSGVWETVDTTEVPPRDHLLTPRELEVITWVARGKSAWEIGEILGITKRTVDEHTQTAARKLGAVNRTQAVAFALLRHVIRV